MSSRSSSVMPVRLPGGIARARTVCRISGAYAWMRASSSSLTPLGGGFCAWQATQRRSSTTFTSANELASERERMKSLAVPPAEYGLRFPVQVGPTALVEFQGIRYAMPAGKSVADIRSRSEERDFALGRGPDPATRDNATGGAGGGDANTDPLAGGN